MTLRNFTLARLKTVAAVLGGLLTLASTLDWGFDLPVWVTAVATLLTAAAVYAVPNIDAKPSSADPSGYTPRRELVDDSEVGEPLTILG